MCMDTGGAFCHKDLVGVPLRDNLENAIVVIVLDLSKVKIRVITIDTILLDFISHTNFAFFTWFHLCNNIS